MEDTSDKRGACVTIDKVEMLNGVKALLAFHQQLGIDRFPRGKAIESFLHIEPDVSFICSPAEPKAAADVLKKGMVDNESVVAEMSLSLSDISEDVSSCQACELYRQRLYPVVGLGDRGCRLMIIGDWLCTEDDGSLPVGHFLGVQQDKMLAKMLTAINLQPEDVYITNIIKCAIPSSVQPQASHVQSCLSFLRRQILLLAPEIICTMGMIAARAVLDQSQSLSQLRGRFHEYVAENGASIPVLTTYHPTYLQKNPEMKKATWADLQFLARKMGLKTSV